MPSLLLKESKSLKFKWSKFYFDGTKIDAVPHHFVRLFIFNDVCPNVRARYVCGRRVVTFAVVANVHVDIVVTDAAVH